MKIIKDNIGRIITAAYDISRDFMRCVNYEITGSEFAKIPPKPLPALPPEPEEPGQEPPSALPSVRASAPLWALSSAALPPASGFPNS